MSSLISVICLWLLLQISHDNKDKPVELLDTLYETHQLNDTMSIGEWLRADRPQLSDEFDELYNSLYAFVCDFVQSVQNEDDLKSFLDKHVINHNDTRPAYTVTACTCSGQSCVGCAEESKI